MAIVGSLGDIVFSVSPKQVKTFAHMQWSSSMRYATHNRHLKDPLIELTGRDPDTITFSMTLSKYLGVDPDVEMQRLFDKQKSGEVLLLMVGSKSVGRTRWVIQKLNRTFDWFDRSGATLAAKVSVSLLESPGRYGNSGDVIRAGKIRLPSTTYVKDNNREVRFL